MLIEQHGYDGIVLIVFRSDWKPENKIVLCFK